MEKNIKPNRTDNRKKRPGLAGGMAAAGGIAVGGAASAAAAAFLNHPDLDGELIDDEIADTEDNGGDDITTNYGGGMAHNEVVEPEPFDPNEIMINVDDLDIEIAQMDIDPDDVASNLASMEPITAENLMVDSDELDIAIEEPQPIDAENDSLLSDPQPMSMDNALADNQDYFFRQDDTDIYGNSEPELYGNDDFAGTDMTDLF